MIYHQQLSPLSKHTHNQIDGGDFALSSSPRLITIYTSCKRGQNWGHYIQAVWLQGILSEFDLGSTLSIVLFCDNQSAINISTDPVTKQRTKHVEIHMHYIRELVHDKTIILQYCRIDEQIADIFTKRFLEKKFTYLHSLLGVSSSG